MKQWHRKAGHPQRADVNADRRQPNRRMTHFGETKPLDQSIPSFIRLLSSYWLLYPARPIEEIGWQRPTIAPMTLNGCNRERRTLQAAGIGERFPLLRGRRYHNHEW